MFTSRLILLSLSVTLLATCVIGQEVYDVTKQECCDGTVHDKKRGLACCGSGVFNKFEEGCCGSQTVEFPDELSDYYSCCENVENGEYSSYNSMTQVCCDGQVLDVPDATQSYSCCGGQLISYATHTCCGNEIVENTLDTYCCGDQMVEIDFSNSEQCCGSEVINSEEKICCSTYTYNSVSHTSVESAKAYDITEDNQECCGTEIYDSEKEVCCSSSVDGTLQYNILDKPEGLTADDYTYCCGQEVIVSSVDSTRSCCYRPDSEDVSYDVETEQCCRGNIKPLNEEGSYESCCWYTGEFYDAQTETCTAAGVRPITGDEALGPNQEYCVSYSADVKYTYA